MWIGILTSFPAGEEGRGLKRLNWQICLTLRRFRKILGKVSNSVMRWCFLGSQTLFESTMELIKIDLFPSCHSRCSDLVTSFPSQTIQESLLAKHFHRPKGRAVSSPFCWSGSLENGQGLWSWSCRHLAIISRKKFRCPDYSVLRSGHMT